MSQIPTATLGVRRSILMPLLDGYVDDEIEVWTDPTPTGSHWLFTPPPFVGGMDLLTETVVVVNPSWFWKARLKGFKLKDCGEKNTFAFPDDFELPPRGTVTVYCAPGRLSHLELRNLPPNTLLWKNSDGSLRRKEVLNNQGEAISLVDCSHGTLHRTVSSLTVGVVIDDSDSEGDDNGDDDDEEMDNVDDNEEDEDDDVDDEGEDEDGDGVLVRQRGKGKTVRGKTRWEGKGKGNSQSQSRGEGKGRGKGKGKQKAKQREQEGGSAVVINLAEVRRLQRVALRKVTVAMCYARVVVLLASSYHCLSNPVLFLYLMFLANILDVLARWAAKQQSMPMDVLALSLSTIGDRLSSMILLGTLAILFSGIYNHSDTSYASVFIGILLLDLTSFWLQLAVYGLLAGKLRPPTRKEVEMEFIGFMCAQHPYLVTTITASSELFLLALYLVSSSLSCVLFHTPSDGSADVRPGHSAATNFLLQYRILMPFLVCFIVRQMANFVQVLISLSRLSYGVLKDAAERDVIRRKKQ